MQRMPHSKIKTSLHEQSEVGGASTRIRIEKEKDGITVGFWSQTEPGGENNHLRSPLPKACHIENFRAHHILFGPATNQKPYKRINLRFTVPLLNRKHPPA